MLSSLGLSPLVDPSLPAVVTVGGLWLLSLGGVGLWCRHLSGRLTALACVSTLDPLTGLANGRLFESERWPSALRASGPLAVLYIDLDHLKSRLPQGVSAHAPTGKRNLSLSRESAHQYRHLGGCPARPARQCSCLIHPVGPGHYSARIAAWAESQKSLFRRSGDIFAPLRAIAADYG